MPNVAIPSASARPNVAIPSASARAGIKARIVFIGFIRCSSRKGAPNGKGIGQCPL